MQKFERVLILADSKTFIEADALRAMLQSFSLTVHLQKFLHYRQVGEFFATDFGSSYNYVILFFHGMGKTEDTIRMEIHAIDQKDGDYTQRNGWNPKPFVINPSNVPQLFGSYRGHVIAMGCGGGRAAWGKAFLEGGCRSYTGFDLGTDEGSSWIAFLVFTVNLFYHMLTETVNKEGRKIDMAEAVRLAAATDTHHRSGTGAYRIYERPVPS